MSYPLPPGWSYGPRTAVLGVVRNGRFAPLTEATRDERSRCVRILVELPRDGDEERDAEVYRAALDALFPGWERSSR